MVMLRFRHAFILSLTIHLVLLPGMGWLAGDWLKAESVTQIIELELATGSSGPGMGPVAAAEPLASQTASSSLTAAPLVAPEQQVDETTSPITEHSAQPQTVKHGASPFTGGASAGTPGYNQPQSVGGGSGNGSNASEGIGAGSAPTGTQAVILPPRVLERQEPEYPASARRANQEGIVGLRIEILANGSPGNISVVRTSGYQALDSAAESAVRNWRFVPARNSQSGAPVASVTVLSVAFRLR